MARICVVKAKILQMHMIFKDLTAPAVQAVTEDLQCWYRELPEVMQLGASAQENLPAATRRSIFHTNLLYLGSMMLVYRRIVSQFLRYYMNKTSGEISTGNTTLQSPLNEVVAKQNAEASLAASNSARIINLMLEDDCIFKRCWLLM
jgi:hypothetical protein